MGQTTGAGRLSGTSCFQHQRYTVHLYPVGLDVVGAVSAPSEVREVELNLVPATVKAHRQHAAEWVNAGRALVIAGAESTANILVVKDLQGAHIDMMD